MVVVTVAAVSAIVIDPALESSKNGNCTPFVPPGWTNTQSLALVNCRTTVALPGDSFTDYSAPRLADGEVLVGQYSSAAAVGGYLLNSSALGELEENP
ncbi:MAG: hypothetical protein WCA77_05270, partial [Thermoplasmata archaeon]